MSIGAWRYYPPVATQLDLSGVIAPEAEITFYAGDTSTLAVTYSDHGLTTPNANPVIASGAGVFPAIFLDPAVDYKAVCTEHDDGINTPTQFFSQYPVTTKGAMLNAVLASGLIQDWNPSGYTGAVDAIRITPDSGGGSILAGLVGGYADRRVVLLNVSEAIFLIAQDDATTPSNGFLMPGDTNAGVSAGGSMEIIYDAVSQRWRPTSLAQAPYFDSVCSVAGTQTAAGELLFVDALAHAVTFPADFVGSFATVPLTLPAADYTVTLKNNSTAIATAVCDHTTGLWTWSSTGHVAISCAKDTALYWYGSGDTAIAGFGLTAAGSLVG